jgi:imidazolonepropionase-like amidohydrolase
MRYTVLIFFITLLISPGFSQDHSRILLVNGFIHVGNGNTVPSGLIAIEDGKISFIRNAYAFTYEPKEWDTIIELKGRHIYPGFIAPNSTLGITEIDAVRATRDYDEVGSFNPHIRTQVAFNVTSKVIGTVRTNGVLVAQVTPRGGIVSGSSSIMKLHGWNWEDATIVQDDGIHLNWPESLPRNHWKKDQKKKKEENPYTKNKQKIYDFFAMAKAYASTSHNVKSDSRLEAMRACFKGQKRVFIHANELQQLSDIIDFVAQMKLKYPVIVGGYDANLISRKLADAKIPVMLLRPHSLPFNEEDDIDHPYKLPYLLKEAGVKFCIQNEGDMEAMNARNIPFLAGTAMAYGLEEEDAISSISLWSCEILGIQKNYGSIEKGKSATLFVSDGDALDMRTNNIFLALVDGEFIPITNSQTELYQKYLKKYEDAERTR